MLRHAACLLIALLGVIGACSEPATESSAPTPETVFAAARSARAANDYAHLYTLLAPETQQEMLGTLLVQCSFATLGPDTEQNARNEAALDAVFAQHGVTDLSDPMKVLATASKTLERPQDLAAGLAAFALEHRGTTGILELVSVHGISGDESGALGRAILRGEDGDKPARDIEFVPDGDGWRLRLILQ